MDSAFILGATLYHPVRLQRKSKGSTSKCFIRMNNLFLRAGSLNQCLRE